MRRRILESLWEKDRSFVELASICEVDHGKLGYHLRNMRSMVRRDSSSNGFQITEEGRAVHEFLAQALFNLHLAIHQVDSTKQQVEKHKSRFQTLFNLIPDPVSITDENGKILAANHAMEKLTGFKREELLGKDILRIGLLRAKSKAVVKQNLAKRMKGMLPAPYEVEALTKDGKELTLELKGTKIEYGGKPADLVLLRDISERKRMENQIKQQNEFLVNVLKRLTHPFYVVDANDYMIKIANPAATLGELSDKSTCYALTHRSDKPCGTARHPCPLEEIKKTKKSVTVEHIHYDKDGNARNVEVHAFPIFDSKGNVSQIIEYSIDITERKKMK